MLKPAVKALSFLIEGAGVIGTIGTVATVGDIVAQRTGVLPKGKTLLGEAANFALDVAGIPHKDTAAAPAQLGAAPALPAANGAAAVSLCPFCQDTKPFAISGAGEVVLENCAGHERALAALCGHVGALYEGWAQHYGVADLGASVCGNKPVAPKKYNALAQAQYLAQFAQWQDCVEKEKQNAAAAKQAVDTQKAVAAAEQAGKKKGSEIQKKLADMLLSAQQKKADQAIADLKAQYAAEKDTEKQAAIQAQIDAANQAKSAAEKVAADLQAKATSDAQAKQIADLQAQVLAAGQKPGGLDQMLQFMMMQQMQQPQYAQPQYPPQYMQPGGGAFMPYAPQDSFLPTFDDGSGGDGGGLDFAGVEPTLGSLYGLDGITPDEGETVHGLVQNGAITREDIEALLRDQDFAGSSCIGGCSVLR